ncbi:Putative uncharacterized protein [Moritella viscosa]|uniref:hypothetical protein n=1 Tax=Moritella viscosa TaxID=80854 RepID=UPI0009244FBC|nr:hypothetical protein [Moritella viscosa]SGZ09685.1 Putative uncharacterized protein [Moritella viscosa]
MIYNSVEDVPEDFKHVISLFLSEQKHKKFVKSLHETNRDMIFQVVYYLLTVSDKAITVEQNTNSEFNKVVELLENSITAGAVDHRLEESFRKNISAELENIQAELVIVRKKLLKKKFSSYDYLVSQGLDSDAKKLLDSELAKQSNKKLSEQLNELLSAYEQINNTSLKIDFSLITTKLSGEYPTKNIAYLVCNPARLSFSRLRSREIWPRFPMKWAVQKISVASLYDIVDEFESGVEVSHYVLDKYNQKQGFDDYVALVDSLVVQHALGHFDGQRKQVLRDITAAYRSGHFSLCVYAALPMIEGLLWEISNYVQKTEGGIFNLEQEALVKGSSRIIRKPKIRQIIAETVLSDSLDSDFINYFCSELYDERNGALHGRVMPDISASNAGKKILTIEYLLDFIAALHQKKLFKHLENFFSSSYIDELLEKISKA